MANEQPNAMDLIIQIKSQLDKKAINDALTAAEKLKKSFGTADGTLDLSGVHKKTAAIIQRGLSPAIKEAEKQAMAAAKAIKEADMAAAKAIKEAEKQAMAAAKSFQEWNMVMLNFGLSVMFFGMQIQRFATTIIKGALQSFNKITQGAEGSGGAVGVLGVHFELLKFSIGEALNVLLEAWLPTIIEIILAVSEWIQEHDELVAQFLLLTAAIGAIMAISGSLILFLNGVLSLMSKISAIKGLSSVFSALTSGIGSLVGATGLTAILVTIGLIIAAIVLLWAMWETNFGNIRDFTKKTFENIKNIVMGVLNFIWTAVRDIWAIITNTLSGDFDKVFQAFVRLGSNLLKLGNIIGDNMSAIFINVFVFALNIIKDLLISTLLDLPLSIFKLLGKIPGLEFLAQMAEDGKKLTKQLRELGTIPYVTAENMKNFRNKPLGMESTLLGGLTPYELIDMGSNWGLEIGEKVKNATEPNTEATKENTSWLEKLTAQHKQIMTDMTPLLGGPGGENVLKSTPIFQTLEEPIKNTSRVILTFSTTLEENNSKIEESMKVLADSGMKTATTFDKIRMMMSDATIGWTQNQFALQKALGIHETGKINYMTGAYLGDAIMSSMFGGRLAGTGQWSAGALTDAYNAGYRGGISTASTSRPSNNQTNVINPVYVTSGGGGGGGKYY